MANHYCGRPYHRDLLSLGRRGVIVCGADQMLYKGASLEVAGMVYLEVIDFDGDVLSIEPWYKVYTYPEH